MNGQNLAPELELARDADAPAKEAPEGHSLAEVLQTSTQVSEMVEECSAELADVNDNMQKNMRYPEPRVGSQVALQKNQAVEEKVAHVAGKIAAVNSNLSAHVRNGGAMSDEMAELVKREASARHSALHDGLTGLPNRALLDDRLAHGLAMAMRHQRGLAVMFMDLDSFKPVNDTYGHAAGDQVLKTVATRLLENTRSDDTASRYGGDEFVYLMMDVKSEADVAQFAEKLLASLQVPFKLKNGSGDVQLTIAASIGIALFPEHGMSADGLMNLADAAMYLAKQSRSGYAFAI